MIGFLIIENKKIRYRLYNNILFVNSTELGAYLIYYKQIKSLHKQYDIKYMVDITYSENIQNFLYYYSIDLEKIKDKKTFKTLYKQNEFNRSFEDKLL